MKKFLSKLAPAHGSDKFHKLTQKLPKRFQDPHYWHLNRESVSVGVSAGVFADFMPPFGQMLIAAVIAFYKKGNLGLAMLVTFISNPFTYLPIYYLCYQLGEAILSLFDWGSQHLSREDAAGLSMQNIMNHPLDYLFLLVPMTLGGFIFGVVFAVLSYYLVHFAWRKQVVNAWERRTLVREAKAKLKEQKELYLEAKRLAKEARKAKMEATKTFIRVKLGDPRLVSNKEPYQEKTDDQTDDASDQ